MDHDLAACQRFRYLVIIDIRMPVMSGLEATRLIRQYERGSSDKAGKITVTAVSAFFEEEEAKEILEAGASMFMTKPLKIFDLAKNLAAER